MSEDSPGVTGVVLARVTVTRWLTDDDVVDGVVAETSDGQQLGLAEALGMLELAKFTLVESYEAGEADE